MDTYSHRVTNSKSFYDKMQLGLHYYFIAQYLRQITFFFIIKQWQQMTWTFHDKQQSHISSKTVILEKLFNMCLPAIR